MLLRVLHASVVEDGPTLKEFGSFPDMLFKAHGSHALGNLVELYEHLMVSNQSESLDRLRILGLLHRLLSGLVHRSSPGMDRIEFPTDMALILLSTLPKQRFQGPNMITRHCAMMAHGMAAIIVHHARLREASCDTFTPFNPSTFKGIVQPEEAVAVEENREGEDDGGGEDDEDDEDVVLDLQRDLEDGMPLEDEPNRSQDQSGGGLQAEQGLEGGNTLPGLSWCFLHYIIF